MSSKKTQEQPECSKMLSGICNQRNLTLRESLQPAITVVINRGGATCRSELGESNSSQHEWKATEINTAEVKGYFISFMVYHVRLVHACDVPWPVRAAYQALTSVLALLVRTPQTYFPSLWSEGQCHWLYLCLSSAFL